MGAAPVLLQIVHPALGTSTSDGYSQQAHGTSEAAAVQCDGACLSELEEPGIWSWEVLSSHGVGVMCVLELLIKRQ